MSFRDIWPWASEHGGHIRMLEYEAVAATSNATEDAMWVEGDIIVVDATAGTIGCEGGNDVLDPAGLHYVAAASSADLIQVNNTVSGAVVNMMVPVYDLMGGGEFITKNALDGAGDTWLGPANGSGAGTGAMTGIIVGETCDLYVDDSAAADHHFGIDVNGDFFHITKILDANNNHVSVSGAAADKIIFRRML